MSKISALEQFLAQLRGVGKMQIGTAGKKIGGQVMDTGRAMVDHPRAAGGGAAAGGLAGFLAGRPGEEEEEEINEQEMLKRYLAQRGQG